MMKNNCMDQAAACKQIQALGFILDDLKLFLDTHPCDLDALKCYEHYLNEYKKHKKIYEDMVGPMTMTSDAVLGDTWQWIQTPFPWELTGC